MVGGRCELRAPGHGHRLDLQAQAEDLIMMGSCGLLMPIGGARFIRNGRYNLGAALGLARGGIPGVLVAAYVVKSLPVVWLRWLVLLVVVYAGSRSDCAVGGI